MDGSEGAQGIDNNDRRGSKELTGKTLMWGGRLTVKVLEVRRNWQPDSDDPTWGHRRSAGVCCISLLVDPAAQLGPPWVGLIMYVPYYNANTSNKPPLEQDRFPSGSCLLQSFY